MKPSIAFVSTSMLDEPAARPLAEESLPARPSAARAARMRRRPGDHADAIVVAFHMACDNKDIETAQRLLAILEPLAREARGAQGARRTRQEFAVVGAYERLLELRRPVEAARRCLGDAIAWAGARRIDVASDGAFSRLADATMDLRRQQNAYPAMTVKVALLRPPTDGAVHAREPGA